MRSYARLIGLAVVALIVAGCGSAGPRGAVATPTPVVIYGTEPPGVFDPTDAPADPTDAPAFVVPKKFETLAARGWAKVVKAPDQYKGKGFKLWACIYQFDAATGEDGFLAYASFKKQPYWYTDGKNAAFTGDAAKLAPFVEGDIVSMDVASTGAYSYDTQAGGNTTVPSFRVVKIKQEKGSCA